MDIPLDRRHDQRAAFRAFLTFSPAPRVFSSITMFLDITWLELNRDPSIVAISVELIVASAGVNPSILVRMKSSDGDIWIISSF